MRVFKGSCFALLNLSVELKAILHENEDLEAKFTDLKLKVSRMVRWYKRRYDIDTE